MALERLHGGQLVTGTDGEVVHVGKRKEWLGADEPFCGWQLIAAELADIAYDIAYPRRQRGALQALEAIRPLDGTLAGWCTLRATSTPAIGRPAGSRRPS